MDINCDQFNSLLADALGGELSANDAVTFDEHRTHCTRCQSEYESMTAAIDTATRRLAPSTMSGDFAPRPRQPQPALPMWRGMARYAAAIALAFLAGYSIRGQAPTDSTVIPDLTPDPAAQSTVQERMARVHQESPEASILTKSFLAVISPATTVRN